MKVPRVFHIDNPHPDIDLGIERDKVDYEVSLPDAGVNEDTGIIFYIHGYGSQYNDEYSKKLRIFFANKYNCIVSTVDYFGAQYMTPDISTVSFPDNFFITLKEQYGLKLSISRDNRMVELFEAVISGLKKRGVMGPVDDLLVCGRSHQYCSFGLLPALDHLQVLHAVLKKYDLDRRRIFLIGTSYGGMIGLFLNKIAPNTFRLIVDNSGFSSAEEDENTIHGFIGCHIYGLRFSWYTFPSFSRSPKSSMFFAPHHRALRDLAEPSHYKPSPAVVHSYHSVFDTVALAEKKKHLHEVLRDVRTSRLELIESEAQLDGRAFKVLTHGMNASMRALFERSYSIYMDSSPQPVDHTDFDLKTRLVLRCAGRLYTVSYAKDGCRMKLV